MNYFVLFTDESIGHVEFVCNCDQCKKRGRIEVAIRKEGQDIDYYVFDELFNETLILRITRNYDDLFLKNYTREETLINICRILQDALLKRGD